MSNVSIKDMVKKQAHRREIPALLSQNLGNTTVKLHLPMNEFVDISTVYNRDYVEEENLSAAEIAQRIERRPHTKNLARYTVAGLFQKGIDDYREAGKKVPDRVLTLQSEIGKPVYAAIQPVVCNIRDADSDMAIQPVIEKRADGEVESKNFCYLQLLLSQRLTVVDGQHRRIGFATAIDWLRDTVHKGRYKPSGLFNPSSGIDGAGYIFREVLEFWKAVLDHGVQHSYVAVECHIGLNIDQERQLFTDLNLRGLKPSKGQTLEFDQADPLNRLIREMKEGGHFKFDITDSDESDWAKDDGRQLRKDVNTVTAFLTLGKGSSVGIVPADIENKAKWGERFWNAVQRTPNFGKPGAKTKTVLSQPVVLKGLAKLLHELEFGASKVRDEHAREAVYKAMLDGTLDFSHDNEVWRSLMLSSEARNKQFKGIGDYVHVPLGTNLDAGTFEESTGWVRYGAKHNDIYRRIGDLIRYQLKLRPRPEVTRAIERDMAEAA